MDDVQEPNENTRRTKKLQLRNARFQGPLAAPRNFTPPSAPHDDLELMPNRPADTTLQSWSSHPVDPECTGGKSPQEDDILQEMSNSSMRRRRRTPDETKSPSSRRSLSASYRASMMSAFTDGPPDMKDSDGIRPPPRSGLRRQYRMPAKVGMPRRSTSRETPKYIESLETNIASLQSQLQAFSSPSSVDTNRAKHRALHSEIKTLRQDLKEWEDLFAERVQQEQEHLAQVNDTLKVRVRVLERDVKTQEQRSQELGFEVEQKSIALQAAEDANYDLERRLEFMSELVATSPGKPSWHTDVPRGSRRKSQIPTGFGTPRTTFQNSLISPDRNRSPEQRRTMDVTAFQPPSRRDSLFSVDPSRDSGYSTERTSELAGNDTPIDGPEFPSSRPASWSRGPAQDTEQKIRTSKRGRRFYPGSAVQSLILPTTRQYADHPASAPILIKNPAFLREPATPRPTPSDCPTIDAKTNSEGNRTSTLGPLGPSSCIPTSVRSSHTTPQIPSSSPSPPSDMASDDEDDSEPVHNLSLCLGPRTTTTSLFEELDLFKHKIEDRDHLEVGATKYLDDPAMSASPSLSSCPEAPNLENSTCPTSVAKRFSQALDSSAEADNSASSTTMRLRLRQLLTFISTSIETHSLTARQLFGSTWNGLTVSRHVLEFRCWLIRLLVGRLRLKGILMHLRRPAAPRPISAPSASLGLGFGRGLVPLSGSAATILDAPSSHKNTPDDYLLEALDDDGRYIPPAAPPMNWARFSMTLVCAVGIAIKDGPASLFGPVRSVERARMNDRPVGEPGKLL